MRAKEFYNEKKENIKKNKKWLNEKVEALDEPLLGGKGVEAAQHVKVRFDGCDASCEST